MFLKIVTAGMAAASAATATPDLGYILARDLVARCTAGTAFTADYCFGYIAAAHDTVRAYESWLNLRDICIPAGTPQSEIRDAVLAHLRDNPGDLDAQAASVVVVAMRSRFPCAVPIAPPAPVPVQR
ncbi:MAG TPA: Rap1a/Tai family immunity protein [Allosphingosinicella sp.]|jgi:hypothetical protein